MHDSGVARLCLSTSRRMSGTRPIDAADSQSQNPKNRDERPELISAAQQFFGTGRELRPLAQAKLRARLSFSSAGAPMSRWGKWPSSRASTPNFIRRSTLIPVHCSIACAKITVFFEVLAACAYLDGDHFFGIERYQIG